MLFKNASKDTLDFTLHGDAGPVRLQCAAGATCDVPDEFASAMHMVAPQLKKVGAEPSAPPAPPAKPAKGEK